MNDTVAFIIGACWIVGIVVCGLTGLNKRIGAGAAIGIALIFTPLVGIIVAMLSKDLDDIKLEQDTLKAIQDLRPVDAAIEDLPE